MTMRGWCRRLTLILSACLTVTAAMLWCAEVPEGPSQSNVFLITIDTLRADHVGCYGDRETQTPALDALAADGIRFSSAFTASPITNPSHASILTGLLPEHDGVRDFGMALSSGSAPLAEMLKGNGYRTAAFIGSVVLDSHGLAPGFDRGFDDYDHFPENLPPTASRYVRLERRAMDVELRAETWILGSGRARPIFVWVHFFDPHDPYDPPEPYRTRYAGRLYDGEIAYADSAVGRFVAFLKRQNMYDTSLIVVVGDHGEGLGQHGEQTHGIFLYDSTLHVPLIVKSARAQSIQSPEIAAPRGVAISAQVRSVDILPTILDLEAIHDTRRRDGSSLRPLWTNSAGGNAGAGRAESPPERVAFGETDYPLDFGWAPLRSVRASDEKYIEAPRPEFYDLGADPGETRNVYEPWNPAVQRLRALEAEVRQGGAAESGAAVEADASKIAELKALGYLPKTRGSTTAPQPSLLPDAKDKIQLFNLIHSSMLAVADNEPAEARRDLEQALAADPKSAAVLAQLGELDLDQGDYREAAGLLGRALAIRPQDPTAAYDQARALYAAGDLQSARGRLESSESLLAGNYQALVLLGTIDADLKDWGKAEDPLQAAILLDSRRPGAYIELARVYLAEKKAADALRQLEDAKRLAPDSPEIARLIIEAQQAEGSAGTAPRK